MHRGPLQSLGLTCSKGACMTAVTWQFMWSLTPGDQEEPGNAEAGERLFRRLDPKSFPFPSQNPPGAFCLVVSVLCALGSVCPRPGPEKPPQVSTLSLTTTGHVFQAKQDRGAGPVGPRWCPLIRVGQETLLFSLECLLPCEPLHPQEVAP